jgi:hypothetical protein
MIQRCTNSNRPDWRYYGGRGITVCKRWLVFVDFLDDVGPAPRGKTIERRDNDGNYEPGNCYWATRKEQSNNTRRKRLITANGVTKTLIEWAESSGLSRNVIESRIDRYGWKPKYAVSAKSIRGRQAKKPKEYYVG